MEWALAILLGGFALVVQRLYAVSSEIEATRAEIRELRKEIDRGLDKNLRLMAGVIEVHLDIPDERRIFPAKEEE